MKKLKMLILLLLLCSSALWANETKIEATFDELEKMIHDVNRDGKINCIDYAVLFQYLYGPEAKIMHNTKLNHLFIRVGNVDIEPQGHSTIYKMQHMWSYRYDPNYNREVTDKWKINARR